MKFEKFYRYGELDGGWTKWFDTGQKEFECYYEDGWKDCLWYENGNKHRERHYNKDGVLNGILTNWYESGEKMFEERHKNGGQESLTSWYENGQKHIQKYYKYVKHEYETRRKDGRIDKETGELMVEDGLHTEWGEDGKKTLERYFSNGEKQGLLRTCLYKLFRV